MAYTDVFGGSTVQPADTQFASVTLSANTVTYWPAYATTGQVMARIMKVSATTGSLTLSLPDATKAGAGQDVLIDNAGAETFTVLDYAGGVIATLTDGQVKYLYLSDSSTTAGTWRVNIFGVGASTLDASAMSGYGVKAISNTINTAAVATVIGGNTAVVAADRSKVFVWSGSSGTLTLPTTIGSTSDFAIEVRNQGTGTLTLAPVGGVMIDASATITLGVAESCFVHMGATDWYTVGRGRNTAFNFTQLSKATTGGTTVLTPTEASNVVQKYTGALVSDATITLPAVVQVYYVSNATTGAYTLTFGCAGGGASIAIAQSQAAILFCDGTNIINANTSLSSGIASIIFSAGSVTVPSIALAESVTGIYASGTHEIGFTSNGVHVGKWTGSGMVAVGTVAGSNLSGTSSGANTGDNSANSLYSGLAASKQDTLVSTTNIKSINGASIVGAGDLAVTVDIASVTHAAVNKATPVDADEIALTDSAASFGLKNITWSNVKTTLAGVFAAKGANSDITSLSALSTPLTVAQGGVGAATLAANNVLLGNGTSALQVVAPGTSGNLLTSNGTTWASTAPASSVPGYVAFAASSAINSTFGAF